MWPGGLPDQGTRSLGKRSVPTIHQDATGQVGSNLQDPLHTRHTPTPPKGSAPIPRGSPHVNEQSHHSHMYHLLIMLCRIALSNFVCDQRTIRIFGSIIPMGGLSPLEDKAPSYRLPLIWT